MELHFILLLLGTAFIIGLIADVIGSKTRLPRVSLLILVGVLLGPSGFDFVPDEAQGWYEFFASTALTMVAFLLGGALSYSQLREHGKEIFIISITVVTITSLIIFGGLLIIGLSSVLSLLLAGISTATAPAATQDVVRQSNVENTFTKTLLGIVAVDDAWALILFSGLLIISKSILGDGSLLIFQSFLWEVSVAILIGVLLGLPAAFLTGRIKTGEPMQSEALGLVFICAGLAIWLDVSFLLAGMILGATISNFATHHERAFHEIENIEWPFMVLFFVLAGASLQIGSMLEIGAIGLAYIILRTISRLIGGWLAGRLLNQKPNQGIWFGIALMPQAGVAIGMALVAGHQFPELQETILTIAISTTVVFEIFGPVCTQIAINRSE
ncbi:MAG: cation:proton antiporter, partial [Desulfobulbia bacterium]